MSICPECDHDGGWEPIGPYRSMCLNCGAVVKNAEAGTDEEEAGDGS